jgi:FAD/FMN-containing dehydrogenase
MAGVVPAARSVHRRRRLAHFWVTLSVAEPGASADATQSHAVAPFATAKREDAMVLLSTETTYIRGTGEYEAARRATVWNGLVPERFPDVIVHADDTDDVIAALNYARVNGHRVGVRSGGHSWAASHLRDGGLLLDVGALDHCSVDQDRMIATVGPGKVANVFAAELDAQGLFFPAGHCEGICLGGYLLQGGYGWNSPVLGPACESVLGLEVVTADGELIYCDAEHHPDLYWAARGSGPGFFGVVTSFTLRIHPRPAVIGTCMYLYPIELVDEVFTWGRSIRAEIDERVELQILTSRSFEAIGFDRPGIVIASPVFADTEDEATKALAVLGSCPVADQALIKVPYATTTLADWYSVIMNNYPHGHRYIADNMFTSASAEELLPGIRAIVETMPPHPSHLIFTGWNTSADRADMVYGVEDEIYIALYTVWNDPADDEQYRDWASSSMANMSHLATGIALADENLGRRSATFISDANMTRLEAVRMAYDPDRRFHSWMSPK